MIENKKKNIKWLDVFNEIEIKSLDYLDEYNYEISVYLQKKINNFDNALFHLVRHKITIFKKMTYLLSDNDRVTFINNKIKTINNTNTLSTSDGGSFDNYAINLSIEFLKFLKQYRKFLKQYESNEI